MDENKKKAAREQLFKAILSLNTMEECADFFDDLCTLKELEAFTQRFHVARRILNGETYEMINLETNARSNLIFRMKKSLQREKSCLREVLERLPEKEGSMK
ncbi:YerC/YecD family TrpR-related protein [Domibacillus sp. DTU_2020_1001157_1_SI_ALB_TIR_016]|uniref:YerC/YecD family TrpR-related protein n=1 Tax=Domibacillus sp. DTU_2020_1001157_1_SI_ALB_TIR_016 TaxID=3077789 RepID=UPI0028E91846|nr:YerC/YecD family TrpR-related protein [Domibacillus sp. DTU_2020_1001157_1_SI_ALB_TIR_016]WNS78554.1 YerC/YecD family TrpR-related protein [Domibacillus sp. DTU_2020_1001157_1_SI_ALB_TIR_016]